MSLVNLLANDAFQPGEPGVVTKDGVSKITVAGLPPGAVLVTALAHVSPGQNGSSREWQRL